MKYFPFFIFIVFSFFSCKHNRMYRFDEHKQTISRPCPFKIKRILISEIENYDIPALKNQTNVYFLKERIKLKEIMLSKNNSIIPFNKINEVTHELISDSVYFLNNILKPNKLYKFTFVQHYSFHPNYRDLLYLEVITDDNSDIIKWEVIDIYYKIKSNNESLINKDTQLPDFIRVEKQRKGKTIIRYKKSRVPKKRD